MEFQYSDAPQRSPEWLRIKRGRIGASSLWRWLSVSKSKATPGKPLKDRLDYEKELMFERQFDTSFEVWVNSAMQDGIDFESFAADQYAKITGFQLAEAGCYYNDYFVASPDRFVFPKGANSVDLDNAIGLIEVKILKDNAFVEVLAKDPATSHAIEAEIETDGKVNKVKVGTGVPEKHWKQIQGQLWASQLPWCDYVAVNFNTKRVVIIRVYPDKEFHEYLELAVQEKLVVTQFDTETVHPIIGDLPEGSDGLSGAVIDRSDSNIIQGETSW